jgi:ArsR family transcriptional regulator
MTSLDDQKLTELIKALGHPVRLRILKLLVEEGPSKVWSLQSKLELSQSLVSHHLSKLRNVGLIICKQQSREIWYRATEPLAGAVVKVVSTHPTKRPL